MLPIEKNILNTLDELSEQTRQVIDILSRNSQEDEMVTENFNKAQDKLGKRKELLDQFEAQTQQLRNLNEAEEEKLEAASEFQEKYEQLISLDETMQKSIQAHITRVEKQTRTNQKEQNVNQKYADQRGGSVGNSLFITSKLEG